MANGMTRPGLLAFMPPQRAARMFTQMAQPTQAQVSPGRVSPLPYPVYESGPMRGRAMPPYMDLQQRAAAQAQATPPRPMPLEQAAMRAAQIRGGMAGQRLPQAPAAGGMGRIADAFRQPLTSPTGQGIAAAALTGLEYGGPSLQPTSLGQGLARMGAAGLQAYASGKEAEDARAVAERKEQREIAAANKPKFQVVGDRLFKIMPDGRYEDITGDMPAKPAKIAGEGPRIRQKETGREVETVYDAQNNLYPAGAEMTPENRLAPEEFDVVSVYSEMTVKDRSTARQTIKEEERPIKMIDKLASEIIKLEPGAAARIRRDIITSLKTKAPDEFGELTDEEIAARVADGALTALVGASRLSLFGPGVLTASEAELARQVFVGPGGQINDPTLALNLLYSIRNDFVEGYSDSVDYFNSHRGNRYKKYTGEDVLDWNSMLDEQGRIRIGGSGAAGVATSANTTPGGNTWSRVN